MSRVLGAKSFRTAFSSLLTIALVSAGGIVILAPAPAAQAAGAPIVIDDFEGNVLGTRTITNNPQRDSTTPAGSSSIANGVLNTVSRGNGNSAADTTLVYDLPGASGVDLTAGGNNKQFFLEFNKIQRLPEVEGDFSSSAIIGVQLVDSAGNRGNFSTGIANTFGQNIVLNWVCTSGACFSGNADYTKIKQITVTIAYPTNYDYARTLYTELAIIRTTPLGGVQPPVPTAQVIAPPSTVMSVNPASVSFDVVFSAWGAAREVSGFTADDVTVSGTATPLSNVVVTGGPSEYVVTVGPLSTSGTIKLNIGAGAATDTWGQRSLAASSTPTANFVRAVAPLFTSTPTTGTATVGVAGTVTTLTASGAPAPTFSIGTGSLPSGITLSSAGVLSGTPATGTAGTYTVGVVASNFAGSVTRTFVLTVNQRPAITSAATATFVAGTAGSFTVTTTGAPTSAISRVSGALPTGLSFTDNGNGTATIAGTPGVLTGRTYTYSIRATNTVNPDATQAITITVNEAPAVTTSPSPTTVLLGAPASFTAEATGFPVPAVQWQRHNGASWGNVSGATSRTYSFEPTKADQGAQFRAVFTNTVSSATTSDASVTVQSASTITSAATTGMTVGEAGSFVITADGVPVPNITHGTAPDWLTFTTNPNGSVTVSGTPPVSAAGSTVSVSLTATNGIGAAATSTLEIIVSQKPVIDENPQNRVVEPGTSVALSAAATGFPQPTVRWQHAAPSGASFTDIVGATGSTYTFTAATSGNGDQYRALFTNSVGVSTTTAAVVRVGTAPAITSRNTATFVAGAANSVQLSASFGGVFTESGAPSWLTLANGADGSATLSGTAPASAAGSHPFTLTATNTFDPNATQSFTLTVDAPPVFASSAARTFRVGEISTFTVSTTAGFPTARDIVRSGTLPAGVAYRDNGDGTATISGIPLGETGGVYPLVLTSTSTGGAAAAAVQEFTLTVTERADITSANSAIFTAGVADSFTVTTNAGYPAASTLSIAGALPSGVTFVDNLDGTATLSGTPTLAAAGDYALALRVDNGVGDAVEQDFSLRVNTPALITSSATDTFEVGASGSFTVTTSAGYPVARTLSVTGTLPGGISFAPHSDGTATLGGTPAVGSGGSYPLTFTAQTVGGTTAATTQSFTLVVNELATFSSATSATFLLDAASAFTVTTAQGFPVARALSSTGALPLGVTFADNGDGTATLAGTPTETGTFVLSLASVNRAGVRATQAFSLTVNTSPTLTSDPDSDFVVGVEASFPVAATPGNPTVTTLATSGSLPGGLTFTDNGDGTGSLHGAPQIGTEGTYPVQFVAANGVLPNDTIDGTITIVAAAAVSLPSVLPTASGSISGVPAKTVTGQQLSLSGSGFAPGAPVTIGMYSTPRTLGTTFADASGTFFVKVTMPGLTGAHTIVATGIDPTGSARYLADGTLVAAPVSPAALVRTGVDGIAQALWLGLLLVVAGFGIRRWGRRRLVVTE